MLLKFATIRKVESPSRGHATDAGIDFKCPNLGDIIDDMKKNPANSGITWRAHTEEQKGVLIIPPGVNAVIPSGIKVEIPYGYMGLFLNKSGIASKNDILIGAAVIDTFYSGEVHIDLHNVGIKDFIIEEGMKLAQMALVPILSCDLTLCDEESLYDWMKQDAHRGEGGFGSTGK